VQVTMLLQMLAFAEGKRKMASARWLKNKK